MSWSHTINGSAALVYLTVDTYTGYNLPPAVSCSVGATAMTQLGLINYFYYSANSYRADFFVFGLLNPPQGPQTVSTSITGKPVNSGYAVVNSVSYRNVLSFGTVANTTGIVTSGATTMTHAASATGQPLLSQAFAGLVSTFSAYKQNQRYLYPNTSQTIFPLAIGDAASPNAVFTATDAYVSGNTNWASLIVPMYA